MSSPVILRSSESIGPIEELIIAKITSALNPTYLKIANDSHKHSHHKPMQTASNVRESHFRIEVVSDNFEGKNMPSRHRVVYQLLNDEFENKGLHALQMKTRTTKEAEKLKKY
ncbi:CIC11C00000004369 [Sungouiella intermedia]|uniref:CIC11C00000004369 n=1 Tax=Sungouiella intermedia TaxID=45354 RepID=A0A1L0CYD0_9ASCO|nr:CIC11C00000004369 [[Candida] intermedia]